MLQLLDIAGPLEVFSVASWLDQRSRYETVLAARLGGWCSSTSRRNDLVVEIARAHRTL